MSEPQNEEVRPEVDETPESEPVPDTDYAEGQAGDEPIDYDEQVDHGETGPDNDEDEPADG